MNYTTEQHITYTQLHSVNHTFCIFVDNIWDMEHVITYHNNYSILNFICYVMSTYFFNIIFECSVTFSAFSRLILYLISIVLCFDCGDIINDISNNGKAKKDLELHLFLSLFIGALNWWLILIIQLIIAEVQPVNSGFLPYVRCLWQGEWYELISQTNAECRPAFILSNML